MRKIGKESLGGKLEQAGEMIVLSLGALLFILLCWYNVCYTRGYQTVSEEMQVQYSDSLWRLLLGGGCYLGILFFVIKLLLKREEHRKRNLHLLLAFVCVFSTAASAFWVLQSLSLPLTDQLEVSQTAVHFLTGDLEDFFLDSHGKYFYTYPHQVGMIAFLELFYRIFGANNYVAFQLFNALCVGASVFVGFQIVALLFEREEVQALYLLLAAGCLPLFCYSPYVYGEIISYLLSMTAIWLFLLFCRRGQWRYGIGCGAFLAGAVLLRNNCLIVLVAMGLLLLVKGLAKGQWRYAALALFLLLSVQGSRKGLQQIYETRAGFSLDQGMPMNLWVAMGMQDGELEAGWYNDYPMEVYQEQTGFDKVQAGKIATEDIKKSAAYFLQHPDYMLDFYQRKFVSQWTDPTYQCFVMTAFSDSRSPLASQVYDGALTKPVLGWMNFYQSVVFLGGLGYVLVQLRRRKEIENDILLIIILGGAMFHMLWEAKSRYILPYFVMCVPLAAAGLWSAGCWIKEKLPGMKQLQERMKRLR